MCEGRRPGSACRPPWALAAELRRREAAADARLAAARARLAEALAELERARARAAELQRRLEENYGKRRRLKRVVAATRFRIHETRALLQDHQDPQPPRSSSPPNPIPPPRLGVGDDVLRSRPIGSADCQPT